MIVGGLELATLVFMDLEEYEDGDVVIKGLRYKKMDQKIIDTGYGLERFCWAAAGSPTIYEAVYPESVSELKELTKFEEKVSALDLPYETDHLLGELLSKLAGILNIDVGTDAEELYVSLAEKFPQRNFRSSVSDLKKITSLWPLFTRYQTTHKRFARCWATAWFRAILKQGTCLGCWPEGSAG